MIALATADLPNARTVQTLAERQNIALSTGKAAAAAAHGAQLTYATMSAERLACWRGASFPVVVEQPTAERWAALVDFAPVVVRDAGFTEVASGTVTAVARWV